MFINIMKSLKKVLKITHEVLTTFVTFGILPAILFILVTSRTDFILGIRSFDVLTGSMEPEISTGSMVFTMDAADYQTGDIITFKRGNISITHRIFAVVNGQYQTKGDANKSPDPQLVKKADVIGRDFFIIPYLGKFTGFLKTLPGFLIFIVLPVLIFIGFEIWNIKEEYKKQIEKKVLAKFNLQ